MFVHSFLHEGSKNLAWDALPLPLQSPTGYGPKHKVKLVVNSALQKFLKLHEFDD